MIEITRMQLPLIRYAREVDELTASASTREETFYPAIRNLLAAVLAAQRLPFDVRASTSERRTGGGIDLPDIALYDGAGDFIVVPCEVKWEDVALPALAVSEERGDQIGRYLARTRVVLLSNLRAFGLLTCAPEFRGTGPVPPTFRRLEEVVEFWPSDSPKREDHLHPQAATRLADLVEAAATRFAPIAEPESLARILARQARRAKAALPDEFGEAVKPLLEDFGQALGISFEGTEGEEFFRSSLIQTIFYGLFAGWALHRLAHRSEPFRWQDLPTYLKVPFLGGLIYELQHPQRLRELNLRPHLDIATETFARVDAQLFFTRFKVPGVRAGEETSDKAATNSAIVYFYEPFLASFDPDLRKELGVWFTPPEIVEYQVKKLDRLLRDEMGCTRGFADESVVVLDPCCGTGAYLIEVLRCIARQLEEEGVEDELGAELLKAFTTRVFGFEILTAPFVVSQLQLYLILSELGAAPANNQRLAIFLTNALTGWSGTEQLKLHFPELREEHDAARQVKTTARIIVILGNPPYNRFAAAPIKEEAELVDHYKGITRNAQGKQIGNSALFTRWKVRKQLLNDLFIRFFRLAELRIADRAEYGVVSFISNSIHLIGRSHPLMRESLLRSFHTIHIDNLHGNRLASERTPTGDSCETIFNFEGGGPGIKVGTAITTMIKRLERAASAGGTIADVLVRDFWGRAERKRAALLESLQIAEVSNSERESWVQRQEGPRQYETFTPTEQNRWKLVPYAAQGGYEEWPALDELFPSQPIQGVNPNRGLQGSVIDTDEQALRERMEDYFSQMSFAKLREKHPALCEPFARYEPETLRKALRKASSFHPEHVVPYVLFPLDARWIYYETEGKLLNERRPELWRQLPGNEFLITVPEPRRTSEARPLIVTSLFDLHLHDRGSVGIPADIRPHPDAEDLFNSGNHDAHANLSPEAWAAFKSHWRMRGGLASASAAQFTRHLFRLALAIGHAPAYQRDHKDSLGQDWAHLPIPKDRSLFEQLVTLGNQIATLLNPFVAAGDVLQQILGASQRSLAAVRSVGGEAVREDDLRVRISYFGAAVGRWIGRDPVASEAQHPAWGDRTGDLFINNSVFFANVPEAVWRFELGGYPVLKKWLGYRHEKRRGDKPIKLAEKDQFRAIVQRIAALLVLHPQLDSAYDESARECFSAEELTGR